MIQTNEIQLWHKILGHINFESFVKTNKRQLVKGLPNISKPIKSLCKSCHHGKQTRVSFKTKEQSSSRPLEMIHTYLCGPAMVQTLQGERYFILLIDDFTRMIWVTFLKENSKYFDKFKRFKELVENEIGLKIKCLRSNNGGEFMKYEFNKFCEEHRIQRQFLVAKIPQQNRVVRRKNIMVQETKMTMLIEGKLPQKFWREPVGAVIYILNRA